MASKTRSAQSVWTGSGMEGSGKLTAESGAFTDLGYSLGMRFGDASGTNPEELIAAAHAGCFNMALAVGLGREGHTPDELRTRANVTVEKENGGWRVTKVVLDLTGKVPGMSEEDFVKAAEGAKAGCPISKLLNAEISLNAKLG